MLGELALSTTLEVNSAISVYIFKHTKYVGAGFFSHTSSCLEANYFIFGGVECFFECFS
jgi:hypothetical protein